LRTGGASLRFGVAARGLRELDERPRFFVPSLLAPASESLAVASDFLLRPLVEERLDFFVPPFASSFESLCVSVLA